MGVYFCLHKSSNIHKAGTLILYNNIKIEQNVELIENITSSLYPSYYSIVAFYAKTLYISLLIKSYTYLKPFETKLRFCKYERT